MTNTITPLAAFDDNYIWCIADAQQKKIAVVDPGDAQPVIDYAAAHGYQLVAILITHHHFDHTGGIQDLLQAFGDMPVYGGTETACNHITHALQEQESINVLGQNFTLLTIPGHTLDHVAYFDEENQQLLCGDTLFLAGCGRVFEGTMPQMHSSLQTLMALPGTTLVYPTHEYSLANLAFAEAVEPDNQDIQQALEQARQLRAGNTPTLPTQLSTEALINPFVRCHIPNVIVAAQQRAESKLDSQAEVFATLREWKNQF